MSCAFCSQLEVKVYMRIETNSQCDPDCGRYELHYQMITFGKVISNTHFAFSIQNLIRIFQKPFTVARWQMVPKFS